MKSIFNPAELREIIERINKLTPESKPRWGVMTVAQMLKHCQGPIDQALGRIVINPPFLIKLIGPFFKKQFLSGKPFSKGAPTAPIYVVKDDPDFEVERRNLIEKMQELAAFGTAKLDGVRHPFFGKLKGDEVGQLQMLHLMHHLEQFGT